MVLTSTSKSNSGGDKRRQLADMSPDDDPLLPSARRADVIAADLRAQIVEKAFPPGQALPKRDQLVQQYQVSKTTIQEAIDILLRDRFIVARKGKGTFVAHDPPYLRHYGLVLPHRPSPERRSPPQCQILQATAENLPEGSPYRVSVYYADDGRPDSPDYQELETALREHRLAGLMFARPSENLSGKLPLTQPGLARVIFTDQPIQHDAPSIWLNYRSFIDKALFYLSEHDRSRIAVVNATDGSLGPVMVDYLLSQLPKYRMETRPYWMQAMAPDHPQWGRRLVHLLLSENQKERPDGLIICDECIAVDAIAGIQASGARVPEDVDVIQAGNFPCAQPTMPGVQRLGFDIPNLFSTAMDSLIRQRQHDHIVPGLTAAEAVAAFEEELTQVDLIQLI